VPTSPERPRPPWVLIIVLIVIVLAGVVAAVLVVPRLLHRTSDNADPAPAPVVTTAPAPDPTTEAATADPTPASTAEDPPTAPTSVGVVAIDPAVTDDRASGVARTFDVYFSGINNKDYDSVGTVLDPAGSIDPGNTKQMADLAAGTRSTQDSDATLVGLDDSGGGLLAEIRFQSNQDAGGGPRGRTGETCTRWDIVYTLSAGSDGAYRIVKSKAHSRPC
jgi:hypothetical protein